MSSCMKTKAVHAPGLAQSKHRRPTRHHGAAAAPVTRWRVQGWCMYFAQSRLTGTCTMQSTSPYYYESFCRKTRHCSRATAFTDTATQLPSAREARECGSSKRRRQSFSKGQKAELEAAFLVAGSQYGRSRCDTRRTLLIATSTLML